MLQHCDYINIGAWTMATNYGMAKRSADNLSRICGKQIEAAICVAKDEVKTDDTPVHENAKAFEESARGAATGAQGIGRGLFREQNRVCAMSGGLLRTSAMPKCVCRQSGSFKKSRNGMPRRLRRNSRQCFMLELENFMAAFAEWQHRRFQCWSRRPRPLITGL